jgi:two-component system, LytTR family, response regulator
VKPLRAVIADDEAVARKRIRRLLATEDDITIVAECADGTEAVETIARQRPEIVFLDIQMPELDGFGVLRALDPRTLPAIVFVTAHDRYALRAFDVHAIDYLLKPFTRERFRVALDRARDRVQARGVDANLASLAEALRKQSRYLTRVSVRAGGRIVLVDLATVDWLEAADNYVRLHCGRREHLVRETLSSLESQLDPERFARIHRSAIVQIDRILELHPTSHGDMDVVLRDRQVLALSRTYRDRLPRSF